MHWHYMQCYPIVSLGITQSQPALMEQQVRTPLHVHKQEYGRATHLLFCRADGRGVQLAGRRWVHTLRCWVAVGDGITCV